MSNQQNTDSLIVSDFLKSTGSHLLNILLGDIRKFRGETSEDDSTNGFENKLVYAGGDLNYLTDKNHLEDQDTYETHVRKNVENVDDEEVSSTRIKKRLS